MTPETIAALRADLPPTVAFQYFADRESPWLLSKSMDERARVADLKRTPAAPLLERPLVKPVVSASGGVLARADVAAVAHADAAIAGPLSRAAEAGVVAAFALPWHDFELSFSAWGTGRPTPWDQMSRPGGNLVVQLGFPSDHAALMGRYLSAGARKAFEYDSHPVRQTGRPTLAWARLDIEDGVALVEEVQSDWLRFAAAAVRSMEIPDPRSRHLRSLKAYEARLRERYDRLWPRALLLAVLGLLVDVVGVREVFMHQPDAGAALKRIGGRAPPVSLYTRLPRSFGFAPTRAAPPFLARRRRRDLARLGRTGEPLFWRLAFDRGRP